MGLTRAAGCASANRSSCNRETLTQALFSTRVVTNAAGTVVEKAVSARIESESCVDPGFRPVSDCSEAVRSTASEAVSPRQHPQRHPFLHSMPPRMVDATSYWKGSYVEISRLQL